MLPNAFYHNEATRRFSLPALKALFICSRVISSMVAGILLGCCSLTAGVSSVAPDSIFESFSLAEVLSEDGGVSSVVPFLSCFGDFAFLLGWAYTGSFLLTSTFSSETSFLGQVWSLTQFYSVNFSHSRIGVKKCVLNKRTIKVCVS